MNVELQRRLRERDAPFDGVTLHSTSPQPATLVRHALRDIVALLEAESTGAVLYTVPDRSARDRGPGSPRTTTWAEVRSWLVADQRLFIARDGERDVYVGMFPSDHRFYLRFYLDDEIVPGRPLEGRWDVTAGGALIERLAVAVAAEPDDVALSPACEFFARSGAV